MTRRSERVGEQIRGELARLLREEVQDPRIGLVTLTRVDLSPDLRQARIDWSVLSKDASGPIPDPEVAEGLASAAGFLRRRLAMRLSQKRVPELHFHHDASLALGASTLDLIRKVKQGSEAEDG